MSVRNSYPYHVIRDPETHVLMMFVSAKGAHRFLQNAYQHCFDTIPTIAEMEASTVIGEWGIAEPCTVPGMFGLAFTSLFSALMESDEVAMWELSSQPAVFTQTEQTKLTVTWLNFEWLVHDWKTQPAAKGYRSAFSRYADEPMVRLSSENQIWDITWRSLVSAIRTHTQSELSCFHVPGLPFTLITKP